MNARPVMQSAPGAETVLDGRRCLYFAGTGYLGLHGHPKLLDAACEAIRAYGMNSATSRKGYGNQPPLLEVERLAARFFGHEAATTFATAYAGPTVLLAMLKKDFDRVFLDAHAHYAIEDGVRMSGLPVISFAHCDADDLARKLHEHATPGMRVLVASDGVFASTGHLPPIPQYQTVLSAFPGSGILLDDAHGFGAVGPHGRGALDHFGVRPEAINTHLLLPQSPAMFVCGTMSKALGCFGGLVTGSSAFIERLRGASHWFDGANALPPGVTAAAATALKMLMEDPSLRLRLAENVTYARAELRRLGLPIGEEPTPILSFEVGDETCMKQIADKLLARNIAIGFSRYVGTGRHGSLRIAIHATHTREMIDELVGQLRSLLPK